MDGQRRPHRQAKRLKDKKITIYKVASGIGANGYPTPEKYYPIHPGQLWAYTRQLSMSEFYAAQASDIDEEMLFIVNWTELLAKGKPPGGCIRYRANWYSIVRIDPYEGYKDDIKLYGKSMDAPRDSDILPYE